MRISDWSSDVCSSDLETRDLLLTVDEWLSCETAALPPREGPVVIGIDLGGSASMSAAAYYWPQTGRLEVLGTFPTRPSLLNRGQADGVGSRYRSEERSVGKEIVSTCRSRCSH